MNSIFRSQKTQLKSEVKRDFHIRDKKNVHLKVIYSELDARTHYLEFDVVWKTCHVHAVKFSHDQYLRQFRKLNNQLNNKKYSLTYNAVTTKVMEMKSTSIPKYLTCRRCPYQRMKNVFETEKQHMYRKFLIVFGACVLKRFHMILPKVIMIR